MTNKLKVLLLAALIMTFAVPASQAATIDFTSSFWSGATGQTIFSQILDEPTFPGLGGIEVTLQAIVFPFNLPPPELYWDPDGIDGIGIQTYGDTDEFDTIPGNGNNLPLIEGLRVSFSAPIHMFSFTISDLFANEGGPGVHEVIYAMGNDNPALILPIVAPPGNDPGSGGFVTVSTGGFVTHSLTLWADDGRFQDNGFGDHDASLVAIEGSAVPEPGTMILFGSAAAVIGFVRRRKRRQAEH